MVSLYGRSDAFPDRYPTMEAAMRVAEAALDQPPTKPGRFTP
jgi:hypothetical protein